MDNKVFKQILKKGEIKTITDQGNGLNDLTPEQLKEFNEYMKNPPKKRINKQSSEILIASGKISEILDYYDGDISQLSPDELKSLKEQSKRDSEAALEAKAMQIASSPGYQDFMTLPLMSKMFKTNPKRNTEPTTGYQYNMGANGKVGGVKEAEDNRPAENVAYEKSQEDKKESLVEKNNPNTSQDLRVNDSESDILTKMFNFMKRDYEFRSNMEKDKEKYRKEVAERKDAYTDQLIEALTGKKPPKSKKSGVTSKKFGLLKYAALGAAGAGAFMLSKSALANIDWKSILPDFNFDGVGVGEKGVGAMGGAAAGDWKNDTEFLNNVNKYAKEKGIKASDLLSVMAAESGIDPKAVNKKSGATGLIQFMPDTAKELGTSTEELRKMSRSQQFEYVKKHLDQAGLKSGSSGGEIYAKVFLPGRSKSEILTKQGENYYEANKGLDVDKSGDISKTDLEKVSQANKKKYNIEDMVSEQTAVQNTPENKDTTIPQKIKETPKKPTQVSVIGNNTNIVNGATNYNVAGTTNDNSSFVDKQYFTYG